MTARLGHALDTLSSAEDLDRYEIPDYVRENPMLSPIPPLIPVADLIGLVGSERDAQLAHDPAEDYARIVCPILLQYGANDTSVPVEASRDAVLAAAPHADVRVYAGLEHLLNVLPTGVTGLSPEGLMYQYHEFRFGQGVWAELNRLAARHRQHTHDGMVRRDHDRATGAGTTTKLKGSANQNNQVRNDLGDKGALEENASRLPRRCSGGTTGGAHRPSRSTVTAICTTTPGALVSGLEALAG